MAAVRRDRERVDPLDVLPRDPDRDLPHDRSSDRIDDRDRVLGFEAHEHGLRGRERGSAQAE
ncbi:hypothetical protein D3C83_260830 [compost metagenome]